MLVKILIIFLIVLLFLSVGISYLKRKVQKMFFGQTSSGDSQFHNFQKQQNPKNEEVIYSKDETVILKGEAKEKKK